MTRCFDEDRPNGPRTLYVQCHLRRNMEGGGHSELTTFLPAKFAVKNMTLKLRTNSGWQDGWKVVRTYSKRYGVPDVRKEVRAHRKRTGDSLPKDPQ